MDWIIGENNLFEYQDFKPNNISASIASHLDENINVSFYLRGSILESERPHINADIDLYLIHQGKRIHFDFISNLVNELSIYNRYVDLHVVNFKDLERDIPNRLLLYCRSLHLKGPKIEFSPVHADSSMLVSHWNAYNPYFAPDIMFSTVRSRVCALKNLTRCFGLLSLYERRIFTREISECLSVAKDLDVEIYNELDYNWGIVDVKQPLYLKRIKDYLIKMGRKIMCC